MKTSFIRTSILFAIFITSTYLTSAGNKINTDSLIKALTTEKNDTVKAKLFFKICKAFREGNPDTAIYFGIKGINFTKNANVINEIRTELLKTAAEIYIQLGICYDYKGDPKKAMSFFELSLAESEKNNYKKGIANAKQYMSRTFYSISNYKDALKYGEEALIISKELDDKLCMSAAYNTIGLIYKNKSDYSKALENYYNSLKIREELKDSVGILSAINNIGQIYLIKKEEDKALEMFKKALTISKLIGAKRPMAVIYLNIGNTYIEKKELKLALEYHLQSLKLAEEFKDPGAIRNCYGNIGNVYNMLKDFNKAVEYHAKSFKISEQYADSSSIAKGYNTMGADFTELKNFPKAIECHLSALNMGYKLGEMETVEYAYDGLIKVYSKSGNYEKALEYKTYFHKLRDSLLNSKNFDEMANLRANYELEQKDKERELIMHTKEIEQKAALDKQKMINIFLSIGGFIILLFAALAVRAYLNKKKANTIIAAQKHEVEEQKEIIEERNKDITDSINYAFRIQHAILKAEEHVSKHLPAHFILFKPKDIVSGDFYWTTEKQGFLYLAAADCTGHGVPGAFLTMLGVSFLNEINGTEELLTPAEILNKLRERIIKELSQTGKENENKDGMDISLARLNLKTNELEWAGANNPLYYVKNSAIEEIKADKQPIAFYFAMKPFTNHKLQLSKGDVFYLFTDGFADQFGGLAGKKFKYKQLQEKLIETQLLSVNDQKQKLNQLFEDWKGNLEQIDDVCIIGVRL